MMECDLQDDDLLGLKLTEMESVVSRNDTLTALGRLADKASKSRKHASKASASLAFRAENLRFFVGDLLGSVQHRRMVMQESQGAITKVQKR
ncbi:hypothetical protein F2Q69_00014678 [Brassica cretica]|uniref:Uncharacterized protein n=1 Tax=Brassica cretica TaxID=69181 RepID=A0A8S9QWI3_BRACR|nr:hypothetical protein F2Q69_00014678 [Brassica cretica]